MGNIASLAVGQFYLHHSRAAAPVIAPIITAMRWLVAPTHPNTTQRVRR